MASHRLHHHQEKGQAVCARDEDDVRRRVSDRPMTFKSNQKGQKNDLSQRHQTESPYHQTGFYRKNGSQYVICLSGLMKTVGVIKQLLKKQGLIKISLATPKSTTKKDALREVYGPTSSASYPLLSADGNTLISDKDKIPEM